jgi:hypothetical protein
MFQKLNLTLPALDISKLMGSSYFSTDDSIYKEFDIPNMSYVRELFRDKVKFDIMPYQAHLLATTGDVPPHLDTPKCKINYYIEVNNEVTFFYKWKDESFVDNTVFKVFPKEHLDIVDSFVAQQGDCYFLNTHVPHSVKVSPETNPRLVLCVMFDEPYNKVLPGIHLL